MSNNPTVTPSRPYSARVEYCACKEEVEALLAKGHSVSMVYEAMKEQGRITCGYSAFCDYVRGGGSRQHSKGKIRPQETAQQQKTAPRVISAPSDRLVDPRTIDPSTLF